MFFANVLQINQCFANILSLLRQRSYIAVLVVMYFNTEYLISFLQGLAALCPSAPSYFSIRTEELLESWFKVLKNILCKLYLSNQSRKITDKSVIFPSLICNVTIKCQYLFAFLPVWVCFVCFCLSVSVCLSLSLWIFHDENAGFCDYSKSRLCWLIWSDRILLDWFFQLLTPDQPEGSLEDADLQEVTRTVMRGPSGDAQPVQSSERNGSSVDGADGQRAAKLDSHSENISSGFTDLSGLRYRGPSVPRWLNVLLSMHNNVLCR